VPLPVIAVLVQAGGGLFSAFYVRFCTKKIKSRDVNLEVRRMRREFNSGAKGVRCDSCATRRDELCVVTAVLH